MRIADDLVADPAEYLPERTELNFSEEGLTVHAVDWGESAIDAVLAQRALGEEPVSRRPLNKEATLTLTVRRDAGVELATVADRLQKKVGLWQREGGWIRRDFFFAEGGAFAGSVACPVRRATLSNFAGWQAGDSPDVTLSLLLGPYWYATEELEVEEVVETALRELQWAVEAPPGSAPGLIRVRVDNDNTEDDWQGLIAAIESRDYPTTGAETTAALVYACENLTPLGDASAVSGALEHLTLTGGWLAFMGSEIDGVGQMTHLGPRRIWLRMDLNQELEVRLRWRALGTLNWTENDAITVEPMSAPQFIDLGEARPAAAALGDQRWEWQVLARAPGGTGQIYAARVYLLPAEQNLVLRAPEAALTPDQQSQKSPGTVANDTGTGTESWSSPGNAKASDDTRTTVELPSVGSTSNYLKATNFGFAIPEGARISGIVAEIERSADGSPVLDDRVRLVKGGTVQAGDRAGGLWPVDDGYESYGGSTDLWDVSLEPADVNASTFGVAISAKSGNFIDPVTARVDYVRLTVYFTEGEDENKVCFATRSIELRSDGVYRQHREDNVWGRLVPEEGFYFEMPPGGLEGRTARGIVIPSQGDLEATPDSGTNKLSTQIIYRPGYLYAREAVAGS